MSVENATAAKPEFLSFTFAPHVLEDLGVNLYTSVAKALVEFVANAHDADADWANTVFDENKIKCARQILKANFDLEKDNGAASLQPLAERTLPDDVQIVIEDNGAGMTRADLEHKFLVIGRRRRKGQEKNARTPVKQRIVMGRKGLGKLAGFGIAHLIEVTSKVETEAHATRIVLNLDELLNSRQGPAATAETGTNAEAAAEQSANQPALQTQVAVPVETIHDGAGLTKGTRIVLKRLVYDAVRGDLTRSLTEALAENFYGVKTEDFAIKINENAVDTASAQFAFAFPENDSLPPSSLVDAEVPVDAGPGRVPFKYRIRFRPRGGQLAVKARGVRVYAHHRLASAPDLLDLKSDMHGLQYTSYLDGIVVADFIDEQPTDYISTDRQSLRWDTPILAPMRDFLTAKMKEAVVLYAKTVEKEAISKVKQDQFTITTLAGANLPPHRERTAWRIAELLAGKAAEGLESPFYQNTFGSVVAGLGHGEILASILKLAEQTQPELREVIREITKLTRHEFDEFMTIVDGRIRAIETLSKLVVGVDFKAAKNEADLHELFEDNSWLIDPTFFEFFTSDQEENELARRLAQHLKIGKFVPSDYDQKSLKETEPLATNERPDLTFLLCNQSLSRLVIVELKAPNTPLHIDHLNQLKGYMLRAGQFLSAYPDVGPTKVEGILIGSRVTGSMAEKVMLLDYEISQQMGPNSPWRVFDILEVLDRTKRAHRELWKTHKKASAPPPAPTMNVPQSSQPVTSAAAPSP